MISKWWVFKVEMLREGSPRFLEQYVEHKTRWQAAELGLNSVREAFPNIEFGKPYLRRLNKSKRKRRRERRAFLRDVGLLK